MNKSSVEAGLDLCKEIGVIDDWRHDFPQSRYALIKGSQMGYLKEEFVEQLKSPTDLSEAILLTFEGVKEGERKAKIEKMVEGKFKKLLHRLDNNQTKGKGMVGPEMGWIYIRLDMIDRGEKLTKEDLLYANKLWIKYGN